MSVIKKSEVKTAATKTVVPNRFVKKDEAMSAIEKNCGCGVHCHCGGSFGKKIMLTLVAVLLVYGIFYLGVLIRSHLYSYNRIGLADQSERFITVSGTGKVTGSNDVAVTTIGYSNVDKNVTTAQEANKKVMDQVMTHLKKMNIGDDDLKTEYSIYPEYKYTPEGGQELIGYRVSQSVIVKVRDLTKVEEVLSLAGMYGANQVGGLQFTIDDSTVLKKQAREKALIDASENLKYLTETLGIKVGKVVNYNEYSSGDEAYYKSMVSSDAYGMGGGVAPVASGSQEISGNVSITYELL